MDGERDSGPRLNRNGASGELILATRSRGEGGNFENMGGEVSGNSLESSMSLDAR